MEKEHQIWLKGITYGNNKFSYEYDCLENIIAIYKNNNLIKKYYYDNINELIKEEDLEENKQTEYTYDSNGNILTKVISNMDDNSIISADTYTYQNSNWEDQLTKFNDQEITYDMVGNPLTIGTNVSMSWINGKDLNTYVDSLKGLSVSYKYNQDGIRVSKIINNVETKYYLDDDVIIYEKRGDNLIHYLYDSTGIVGLVYNENVYYYVKNLQGDIIGILNDNYEQIVSYEYDSWGKVLSIKDNVGNIIVDDNNIGIINPFRYRGYYYDSDTMLYYVIGRYYNPEFGRWISPEPNIYSGEFDKYSELTGHNIYAYCANNPIVYKDENGEGIVLACIIIGAGIGIVAGGCYGAHKAKKKGYSPSDGWKYWKYVVGYGVVGGTVGALVGWGAGALIAKYGVAKAATSITRGGGARFSSFNALKRSLGSAGKGKEWHHIVEQCQIKRSGFSKFWINNSNNVINLTTAQHRRVSAYYSSIKPFTNGMTVRDWLTGQSFQSQYKWGIEILRRCGVKI